MDPVKADFIWWQNVDFDRTVEFVDGNGNPHDFSGSIFEMEIKETADGPATLTVTTDNSGAPLGSVGLSFTDGALAVGEYVYDLVMVDGGGLRIPLMFGGFSMRQGVTQP